MAFKLPKQNPPTADDPESMFRDLRKRTVPGPLSHQADLLRSYMDVHLQYADIALQLPTGSGKTLVGLLIGEWRRRKYGERVVYLCPTRQLVNQVAEQAVQKYGMDLHAFTGKRSQYDSKKAADWQNSEVLAVTTYSSLFNTNPFFSDPNVIILDDAHSAENYVANFWSLQIDRSDSTHAGIFSALIGLLRSVLPHADQCKFAPTEGDAEDPQWVEKLPTPAFQSLVPELVALLDEHTKNTNLRYTWSILRDSLQACHLYLSRRAILIRPLIPPSNAHAPFAGARQRLYMSATLGSGGDLERVTGRYPIHKIPVPAGWDIQGIGRRFFIFPKRSLDDVETASLTSQAIKRAGRALYLVPDDASAQKATKQIESDLDCTVFDASQLEVSKKPFVERENAVAVIANRYDGIDLIDEDCRLLATDGLPGGANLQERFFVLRVTAQLLLDDRILTRLVQGFGRCTRSPNDYAAIVILGETLNNYLFKKENREFFHPEIQAELEFGIEQSRDSTAHEMLLNLDHFLKQDSDWEGADQAILGLRAGLTQRTLGATEDLANAVPAELEYQYALWSADYSSALQHCRTVLGKLNHADLRGYRALWLYLAGSAAWLAFKAGQLPDDSLVKEYFRKAQAAAPVLRWLVGLSHASASPTETVAEDEDVGVTALVERIELTFDELGTIHDRKYDAEERAILDAILQTDDGILFEGGHERLGKMLGFTAGNSTDEAAPDPWWMADDTVFVFEDHAEANSGTVFPARKARQAASHPDWLRENLTLPDSIEIIPVVITPCTKASKGAVPTLRKVRYWSRDHFCTWAQEALRTLRDLRRTFPGVGNLAWRTSAVARLKAANIAPHQLNAMLSQSAADAMRAVDVAGEDS
ncbi:DEAD/DEAH box helicase [Schlesneria sp. T3-172]|uniref:DEAD/DEAH box helicase n=1 Tax=Schlesneria sphaerica TaxID=3373610 RepID=UPI0037CADD36